MARGFPFLLGLGRSSKQAGDERSLPQDVSFVDTAHLPFPDHMYDLVALQGSPCRLHRKEAHPWFDQPFDEAMVLLDEVVQVFDLSQFDRLGKDSRGFELRNGFGIGGILIDIDDARSRLRWVRISRSSQLGSLFLERTGLGS